MGKDGACGITHQSIRREVCSRSLTRSKRRKSKVTLQGAGIKSQTKMGYMYISVVGLLLCLLQSVVVPTFATELECPAQCSCSNVTTLQFGEPAYTMDCSHGGFNSFLENYQQLNKNTSRLAMVNLFLSNSSFEEFDHLLAGKNATEIIEEFSQSLNQETNTSLVILDLSFNNMSTLATLNYINWSIAPIRVVTLNVSNNRIQEIDNLQTLSSLISLDISNNALHQFDPKSVLNISSLKYLYLQHNQITNIAPLGHSNSQYLYSLTYLDISYNNVTTLTPEYFSSFPALTKLNLSHNNATTVDRQTFQGLHKLQYLLLSSNNIKSFNYPVFQNTSLAELELNDMPDLSYIHFNTFQGLNRLQKLNLSQNTRLEFLHPNTLSDLYSLQVVDISGCGFQKLSPLTFQNKDQLKSVIIQNLALTCKCTNAWLVEEANNMHSIFGNVSSLTCRTDTNKTVPLLDAIFPCNNISIQNLGDKRLAAIGSSIILRCNQNSSLEENILTWTTPTGHTLYLQNFYKNATEHLHTQANVAPDSDFHSDHFWHQSSSYYPDLIAYSDRILMLSDGSLYIDYILRSDAGQYKCMIKNAFFNDTESIVVNLSYKIASDIEVIAVLVGILCALGFLTLNLVYVTISWIARRLINKRRRKAIRQMLENLNSYKSTQITRVYENYTGQLNRVRSTYHMQRDRLQKNYTMQVDRVKRGCSHQVEKVRENYNNKLTHLRDYSSSQIMQIRELANTQISRIRDYGSVQFDRLRETYKFQQQHIIKLMETMNLDNCKSIVETECMRTESMMYDLDLLSQEDERSESPFSMAESEYNTAASTPMLSDLRVEIPYPIDANHQIIRQHKTGDLPTETSFIHLPEGCTEPNFITGYEQAGEEEQHNEADIEMEMNSVIVLPDNVRLDAKEVWKYGEGNATRTLYTKVTDVSSDHHSKPLTAAQVKTIEVMPLPSIDLNKEQPESGQSEWVDACAGPDASPVKTWPEPPVCFQFEDNNEDSTSVQTFYTDAVEYTDPKETDTMI